MSGRQAPHTSTEDLHANSVHPPPRSLLTPSSLYSFLACVSIPEGFRLPELPVSLVTQHHLWSVAHREPAGDRLNLQPTGTSRWRRVHNTRRRSRPFPMVESVESVAEHGTLRVFDATQVKLNLGLAQGATPGADAAHQAPVEVVAAASQGQASA